MISVQHLCLLCTLLLNIWLAWKPCEWRSFGANFSFWKRSNQTSILMPTNIEVSHITAVENEMLFLVLLNRRIFTCLFFYPQPFNPFPLCIQFDKSGVYSLQHSNLKVNRNLRKNWFFELFPKVKQSSECVVFFTNSSQMGAASPPTLQMFNLENSMIRCFNLSYSVSLYTCTVRSVYTSFAYGLGFPPILNYLSFDCYMTHWNGSKMTTCTTAINI